MAPSAPPDTGSDRPVPTVLVVDDDRSVRELIVIMLELEGLQVLQAADGFAALEIVGAEQVDLITLDVMMPGMSGWEVADALDADERTANIPRVMVSGKPLAELESAPGRPRARAVLTKPFDFALFVKIAQDLLSSHAASSAARDA